MSDYDSTAETLRHIHRVRDHLNTVIAVLMERGRVHDASKFSETEKPILDSIYPRLRGLSYGSPEYMALVKEAWPGLQHHYRHNSHHPEHYADGVGGMDLFDLVEMFCDWKAASAMRGIPSVEKRPARWVSGALASGRITPDCRKICIARTRALLGFP
jgi:hypothetical protein